MLFSSHNIKNIFILSISIFFLTSCIHKTKISQLGYKTKLLNFHGADKDTLLLHWGEPDKIINISSKQFIYEYFNSPIALLGDRWEEKHTKIDWLRGTSTYTPVMIKQNCKTKFLISANNKIIGSTFYGNDCVAKEPSNTPKK